MGSLLFDNRYREVVYANKGKYGRPFGGLELYAAKHLAPQTVSKTNSHIAIRFGKYVVIGVYYQGTMALDDITIDLMSVINKQPNTTEYIIGGDFNIKPESHNFDELNELLSQNGISLMSDQSKVTYFGTNGVSCVDHIYGSHSIETENTKVLVSGISDHEPISATV